MTYSISLFHEVLSADVSHDARGQSIPHYVHHGAESVSAGEEDIPKSFWPTFGETWHISAHLVLNIGYVSNRWRRATYKAQSTAMIRVMSSVGKPTDVSTITMVTSPACGIPAAPMLAAVAVMLDICVYSERQSSNHKLGAQYSFTLIQGKAHAPQVPKLRFSKPGLIQFLVQDIFTCTDKKRT